MDGIIYFNYNGNEGITHTMNFNGATSQNEAIAFVNKLISRKAIKSIKIKGWLGANFIEKLSNPNDARIVVESF